MAKGKAPSLIEELKELPQRTYAKRWQDKLSPAARQEWEAVKAAWLAGDIVCSGKVIGERFFARFPDAPRISAGQVSKYLREE
jgi:hypothetical protein